MSGSKVRNGTSAPSGGRKLIIRPLAKKPQLPSDFEAVTWLKLEDAIRAVHEKRAVSSSLEELYRAVEDLCLHKYADRLYAQLQKECNDHIGRMVEHLAARGAQEPTLFLGQVAALWADHTQAMLTLRSIFLFLDRTYVVPHAAARSLFDLGLQLLRSHLDQHPQVGRKTVGGLLGLIESERRGTAVDRSLAASLLRMLGSLNLYAEDFEPPFLRDTDLFYDAEGSRSMSTLEVPEYLQHCERRLAEEHERCQQYLGASTRKPLIALVEQQLLRSHVAALLDKGFAGLMSPDRMPDLARLYSLMGRVQALDALRATYNVYIKTTGLAILMDEEKDKDMVKLLLEFKARLDTCLAKAFQNNLNFSNAQKEAFEHFINQRANKPAELIAKFVDAELRGKITSQEELESTLDQALLLFRFISGKDVFEAFYKKDLAKRLLMGRSASSDAEKMMISKLKAECGAAFTNKLEGMFKDVDLSRDALASFRNSVVARNSAPPGIDMQVNVLTSGYWPTYPIVECRLPSELSQGQTVFKDFYLSKHSGRRLVWQNLLGHCIVRANFRKGAHELAVSLHQTVVLMLFNDAESLSFPDIKEASGIEDGELRRTLQSLALGKTRVLIKAPKGKEVEDGDTFSFNEAFHAPLFRIKINSIQMKETAEENAKTNSQVMQDRQYQIDAAIVRVMKTRKQLSHKLLVGELLIQLKFPVRGTDLKKRIESLIDREYLARDDSDPSLYNYLA